MDENWPLSIHYYINLYNEFTILISSVWKYRSSRRLFQGLSALPRQHHLDLPYDWDCGQLLQSRWHHAHWAKVLPSFAFSCGLLPTTLFKARRCKTYSTWSQRQSADLWAHLNMRHTLKLYYLFPLYMLAWSAMRQTGTCLSQPSMLYTSSQTWDSFNRKPIDAKYRAFLGSIDSIGLCLGILSPLAVPCF